MNIDGFPLPIKKLKGTDPVEALDLSGKGSRLGSASAVVIASLIGVNASITHIGRDGLNLKSNNLGDEGWGAIFAGVCGSKDCKITSVDASDERIGPAGAKMIGEALKTSVNASITQVIPNLQIMSLLSAYLR